MGHTGGASGYRPENTLEAFELAIRQGADGIELDVHTSVDGELIRYARRKRRPRHRRNRTDQRYDTGSIERIKKSVHPQNHREFITFQLWQKYWSSCAPQT
mgnify:CR=1 FL=1